MNCGNCGKGNEHGVKICVHCGSTLALTEYYRRKGFVEKKDPPEKKKEEPWDQDILTTGYVRKKRKPPEEEMPEKGSSLQKRIAEGKRAGQEKPSGERKSKNGSGQERNPTLDRRQGKTVNDHRRTKASKPAGKNATTTGKDRTKKIPKSKAYNHTTKTLSLAEKEVNKKAEKEKKKEEKRFRIIPLVIVLFLLIVAAGMFIGNLEMRKADDPFARVATDFARAMVMGDEDALAELIHPGMYGALRPMGYENVERCDTKVVESEKGEVEPLQQELLESYGITDSVTNVYRIHVGCTIYGENTYACTMDITVGEIDGTIYVLKGENLSGAR